MPRPRIGLKDVATLTGVSANTVSLALRHSPRIPEETRERILEAARRLHYQPNRVARSLTSRRTHTVGLVLTDILNPILAQVARLLESLLAEAGTSLMLAASDNQPDKERRAVELFRAHQVDGLLVYPAVHRSLDHLRTLRGLGLPLVLLAPDPEAGLDVVAMDDRAGALTAVRHLIEAGHRRIGLMDAALGLGNSDKADGHAAALAEAGLAADPALVVDPGGHTATHGAAAMPRLMAGGPTAVFCTNDSLALGVVRWCAEAGVAVPGQLAVVGCDDTEAAAFGAVPLTSLTYAVEALSRAAVARLSELVAAEGELPPPRTTLIAPRLVPRRSSGAGP